MINIVRNSNRAGTWGQQPEAKSPYRTQDHQSRGGPTHQSLIKKIPYMFVYSPIL